LSVGMSSSSDVGGDSLVIKWASWTIWRKGVRRMTRARWRCRTVGCSIPDAAPMTLFACQWRISRQSQAELRHLE
jgi:hypothetical protein